MTDGKNISRRQLLRGRLPKGVLPPPESISPDPTPDSLREGIDPARAAGRSFPVIRPPGAVDEATFLQRCTKCDKCIEACPHDAIAHAPIRFRTAAGTPIIDPALSPCRMCEDLPCIASCPEQALTMETIWPIAEPRILDYNCLAHQGSFCTVCSEQCPVPDAISLTDNKPAINLDQCTGCGICHYACPAPTNAIAVMPLAVRPSAKLGPDDA